MRHYREILKGLVLPESICPDSEEALDWILNQLLEKLEIPIDPQRRSSEIARMEAYDSHVLQQEILDTGNYALLLPENREKRNARIRQEAERNLKIDILVPYIAAQEQITVTAEEREQDAQRIAKENQISLEEVRQFMGHSFEMLHEDLLMQKTLRWLITCRE